MAPKDTDAVEDAVTPAASNARVGAMPGVAAVLKRRLMQRYAVIGLVALIGPLAAVGLGLYIYLAGGRYISTDNAYVKSDKIAISADVAGRVTEVAVSENEMVGPGQVLFRVDPTPFQIALERADARLIAAGQGVEALRALYKQNVAGLERTKGDIDYHRLQLDRQKGLSRKNLVSGINLDTAIRNLRSAEDLVKVTEQGLAEALAKLGGDPAIPADKHPNVREAQALRDQAALDLARTVVRAAIGGTVTNFELQPGEYVKAGVPVFSLVGADNVWVHANFKETELTHVKVGQRATIAVDTFPDRKFAATVAGISPATGAEFALLPPQNATGNWVKVVQRFTVRLKLDEPVGARAATAAGAQKLRAGMSAVAEIDTEHKRHLSGMFAMVENWVGG